MGQQELSLFPGGNAKWSSYFARQFGSLLQAQPRPRMWSSDLTPRYFPKWIGNLWPHKNLRTDIQSSFIHDGPNLAATKMSFNRGIETQTLIHPHKGILFRDKKKWAVERRKRKCTFISERSQSEKATCWMISATRHSGRGKVVDSLITVMVALRWACMEVHWPVHLQWLEL